jgi:hypothetical protein
MSYRIFSLFITLFVLYTGAVAQQNRFIYLQTDNKQPFYVRINNMVLSSSASGYMIIPKLKDGAVAFTVGFPKNEQTLNFTYTVNKKDVGFLIKDFGEKGWGLFNLQSMDVLMAKGGRGSNTQKPEQNNNDAFSQVLSEVVNSPDLNNKVPEEKEEDAIVKQEAVVVPKAEPVKETTAVPKQADPVKETPVISKTGEPASVVRLVMNNSNSTGREMIYIDDYGDQRDTIRIFIPAKQDMIVKEVTKRDKPAVKNTEKSEEKFIEMELPNPNAKVDSIAIAKNETVLSSAEKIVPMINSDCKQNASDDDFLKLRKKMAAADNEEEMISAAKKGFKSRCYSTEQIKNLSVLFLNDAGRYNFFDTAYPRVFDSHNFGSLERQLTDPYYITRFQAMIRR